ncbi:MAG: acetyltransferase, partial [Bacillota bacterium]
INGLRIIKDKEVFNYNPAEIYLANGLGSTDVGSRRGQIFKEYAENGYSFINVIHSSAIVADEVVLGKGVQIMAGVIIQPGCKLGNNVLVNTGTVMDHDCNIGEHVHLATGVTVSGNVCIGENTHIGTGAKIINNITIGANCTVGAGAVIIDDIPQNMRVAGVPAKIIGRNQP